MILLTIKGTWIIPFLAQLQKRNFTRVIMEDIKPFLIRRVKEQRQWVLKKEG